MNSVNNNGIFTNSHSNIGTVLTLFLKAIDVQEAPESRVHKVLAANQRINTHGPSSMTK